MHHFADFIVLGVRRDIVVDSSSRSYELVMRISRTEKHTKIQHLLSVSPINIKSILFSLATSHRIIGPNDLLRLVKSILNLDHPWCQNVDLKLFFAYLHLRTVIEKSGNTHVSQKRETRFAISVQIENQFQVQGWKERKKKSTP